MKTQMFDWEGQNHLHLLKAIMYMYVLIGCYPTNDKYS